MQERNWKFNEEENKNVFVRQYQELHSGI